MWTKEQRARYNGGVRRQLSSAPIRRPAPTRRDYAQLAINVARPTLVFMKRAGGQSQFGVPLAAQTKDQGFVELHAWMAANPAADLSVGQLPARAGMAPRTFAQAFAAKGRAHADQDGRTNADRSRL